MDRDQPEALRRAYERVGTRLLLAAAILVAAAIALAGLAVLLSD